MEKKNSLKEEHEEAKLSLGDVETRSPGSETGPATLPLRAVVEERTVSFKLGDLEEAPERERLPSVDLKEETSLDGATNGEWNFLGGEIVSLFCWCGGSLGPGAFWVECYLLFLTRCSAAAEWEPCSVQPGRQ